MAALAFRSHPFHPSCGCYSCDKLEAAAERDKARRDDFRDRVIGTASFLSEVPLNDEELDAAAAAINAGDMAALGTVYLSAAKREADEVIEIRADDYGMTEVEAAEQLYLMHKPEAQVAA